jgi:hypothetical protein
MVVMGGISLDEDVWDDDDWEAHYQRGRKKATLPAGRVGAFHARYFVQSKHQWMTIT